MSSAPAAPAMQEHQAQEAMMFMPLSTMPFPMPVCGGFAAARFKGVGAGWWLGACGVSTRRGCRRRRLSA